MSPTPAGAVLLEHARALFAVERAAEDDLVALRGLGRGRLEVGASTTIATWKLPPILGAFHTAHPAIALRVVIGNPRPGAAPRLTRATAPRAHLPWAGGGNARRP